MQENKLAGWGYSAGGLLVASAINLCPDLLRAAVLKVHTNFYHFWMYVIFYFLNYFFPVLGFHIEVSLCCVTVNNYSLMYPFVFVLLLPPFYSESNENKSSENSSCNLGCELVRIHC